MASKNLVYLDLAEFDGGQVIRGGALVVDPTTEPLEFRCTSAIRPTRLQRILWGARLGAHMAAELIGLPLLKTLQQGFGLVLTNDEVFMGIRPSLTTPLVCMHRDSAIEFDNSEDDGDSGEVVPGDETSAAQIGAEEFLTNSIGRFEPVIIRCHPAYGEDLGASRVMLRAVFEERDVLEPFDRILTALEAVHQQEAGQ